ncbi:hypothetical protein DDE18_17455 [Nocardioides gansuensis]|uniref:DUF4349 domain-containing protein n=1 Tax=Nocardioides gansuensis TaxID=2138300 RepID=A0A2T8F7S4_9ACTN|nr:DUF4349 domain-containing protein [Nocardioides gansuensis]PVG81755.1 hypothetical protein DDE18_17455 [Nocardioides gansuensis]
MTRRPGKHRLVALALALTTTAALAACTSSGTDGMDVGGTTSEAPAEGAQDLDEGRGFSEASGDAPTSDASRPGAIERSVISTGTVSLRSEDVAQARRDVQRVVDSAGGTVSEENTETDDEGDVAYARLVLRVPSSRFDSVMADLEETAELRASQRTAEDVTTQVIDTRVRVRAQQASLKRIEQILARAETIQQVMAIESQLTRRQSDLDSLKAQEAYLSDQTSLSTITVDISRLDEKEPEEEDGSGFLTGLEAGWKALVAAAVAVTTVAGALLPFVVVALVLGWPLWVVVRRAARRRRPPTEAAA